MQWFKVITNLREFEIEADGIGDAIDRVLNYYLLRKEIGEYVREISLTERPALRLVA